ncbi:hypothetical protein BHM03_00040355 [Ensete ventricosum]|nr:hypothetical protein BHM03_00040355 [Ensete ventricosum]
MVSRMSMVSRKNAMVIDIAQSRVSIGFLCTIFENQNTGHYRLISPWKSYKHDFEKKYDGHKHCAKLRAESSFDRFFIHRLGNSKYWPFTMY